MSTLKIPPTRSRQYLRSGFYYYIRVGAASTFFPFRPEVGQGGSAAPGPPPDCIVPDGHREEEAVKPIEHPAVARENSPRVLDPRLTLDRGFPQVAQNAGDSAQAPHQRGHWLGHMEDRTAGEPGDEPGHDPSRSPLHRLVRA